MHDSHAVRALELHIDNTEAWYKRKLRVFESLARKRDKGRYRPELAPRAFSYLLCDAARDYHREHGSITEKWHATFPPVVRLTVALELTKEFEADGWR